MPDPTLYPVEIRYNVLIPTRDGLQLSANLFLPQPRAPGEAFPAILELIPYRKDDWRYATDHARMSYLAARGYACCRLDIRGTGSSPGIAYDEYMPAETHDGYDAVEWLAAQPWCSGKVGMWGISYGGFTSIQVAMLHPPHLAAIVPMYATDDRYTDDVHYIGGCLTGSELAQYAVSMVGMNAMPPRPEYAGPGWAARWKERLEQTPPWLIEWLRQQTDGPYWRSGSLAPHYERLTTPMLLFGGWADGYPNTALRMLARCTAAPRRAIIGPWVHSTPDTAYPAPNIDYLHELLRFFDYWLKGVPNGVMDEPALTYFRQEYTPPEPFPAQVNGAWQALAHYSMPSAFEELALGAGVLYAAASDATRDTRHAIRDNAEPAILNSQFSIPNSQDRLPHRPTHGTRAGLCYGAGAAPNGLARDLRPDEALSLVYSSAPLAAPLDILGSAEAHLPISSDMPVANLVVRLTDVAPDGTSALVSTGILNLTHRESHAEPAPLEVGQVYPVRVELRVAGYRFLPGHRVRLSLASGYWPVIWPAPYAGALTLHRGPDAPARLLLPRAPAGVAPPALKAEPPALVWPGSSSDDQPVWEIAEDVLRGAVTVRIYGGDSARLPDGRALMNSERIELTAHERDPAHTWLLNEVLYTLEEHGYRTEIRASGSIRSTLHEFHIDIQLLVLLNGAEFFRKAWIESVARRLV